MNQGSPANHSGSSLACTMRAVVLHEFSKPFVIEQVDRPETEPDEVLIETRTCGICCTDIHMQDGVAYVPELPYIPGHEPAGVVVEVGGDVNDVLDAGGVSRAGMHPAPRSNTSLARPSPVDSPSISRHRPAICSNCRPTFPLRVVVWSVVRLSLPSTPCTGHVLPPGKRPS